MSRLAFRLAILLALMVVPTSCQESQETASNPSTPGLEATSGSFLLERIVRQRPVGSGEAGWKRFGRWESSILARRLGSTVGIFTPWGATGLSEGLWLTQLRLDGDTLWAKVRLEQNEWPLDETWDEVWTRTTVFRPGATWDLSRVIGDTEFDIEVQLKPQDY
jgi:hypothetical protein